MSPWTALNYTHPSPLPDTPLLAQYTITTPPNTDIWRPDETKDVFTAPIVHRTLSSSRSFKKFRVTVSASWKTQYDQGGLILFWPESNSTTTTTPTIASTRWIKAGIEFFEGVPRVGVVGCDRFADWSLSPIPDLAEQDDAAVGKQVSLTLEAERIGTTLWIYALDQSGKRVQALREVKWAFLEDRDEGKLALGIYGAKPTPDEGDVDARLDVNFSNVEIEETS